MTIAQQIATVLATQNSMNTLVSPDWTSQGYRWYRAIWVETAEMLDHYGWKWWKHQTPDLDQVKLELVDIFHFGLSIVYIDDANVDGHPCADTLTAAFEQLTRDQATGQEIADGFPELLEQFATSTLMTSSFDIDGFCAMMLSLDMKFDELFALYLSKYTLNVFRQKNGYKNGTYVKIWDGMEDNEHLMDILSTQCLDVNNFVSDLTSHLSARYKRLVGGQNV